MNSSITTDEMRQLTNLLSKKILELSNKQYDDPTEDRLLTLLSLKLLHSITMDALAKEGYENEKFP